MGFHYINGICMYVVKDIVPFGEVYYCNNTDVILKLVKFLPLKWHDALLRQERSKVKRDSYHFVWQQIWKFLPNVSFYDVEYLRTMQVEKLNFVMTPLFVDTFGVIVT